MTNIPEFIDQTFTSLHPLLRTALIKTMESWGTPFRNLPVPVRFRASGALHAWQAIFDNLASFEHARNALADPDIPPTFANIELAKAVQPLVMVSRSHPGNAAPVIRQLLVLSTNLLAFWLRSGALYEPTLSLSSLLGGVDMSQELPMHVIQPSNASLCIIPPWQQRHQCGNVSAIMIFSHAATDAQRPAKRAVTFLAYSPKNATVQMEEVILPVKDENGTLAETMARAMNATRLDMAERIQSEDVDIDAVTQKWKQILDYTIKVLLYLSIDDAVLRDYRPYTTAPRELAGLGKRKREIRLAEIEQLYDRYIVGPASLAEWAGEDASELGVHGQLSAHWRRGHFRLQPYGPKAALRKVLFIMPTLIRADRLTE